MKRILMSGAMIAMLASAQAYASVGSDAEALMPAAQRVAGPYQRGLAEGWLEVAERQDSTVLISPVHNDAAARALNNGRHFIDGSVPFQPIYREKHWPSAQKRETWFKALQEIERVNQRASQSPCRGEDAGRLAALTDEAWKEQDETHGTHWVHGREAIERAQQLAQHVNVELDACVPPPPPPAPVIAAPVPAAVSVSETVKPITLAADTLFDFGSATLKPNAQQVMEQLALRIRDAKAKVQVLRIDGYTDRFGSVAHNGRLSLQRAQAVQKALQERGVAADRFEVNGRGAADPVALCPGKKASPAVVACLAPNRRVVVFAR